MMRPDFPVEIGGYVLEKAREFDRQEAVEAVERIRDFLGGDPGRMRDLSDGWNAIETVTAHKTRLNQNNAELAGSWEGPAYESFKAYLGDVAGAMDTATTAMGDMSVLLGDMIVRINEQFRTLINFLADTANDIAQTLTDVVDVVAGVLTLGTSTTLTITGILADFANNVAQLVSDTMVHISEFQSAAQDIKVHIGKIVVPQPLPANAGPAGQWSPLSP